MERHELNLSSEGVENIFNKALEVLEVAYNSKSKAVKNANIAQATGLIQAAQQLIKVKEQQSAPGYKYDYNENL